MGRLAVEVDHFFTNEPGSGLTQLFKQELKLYEKQEKEATGESAQFLSDIRHRIMGTLSSMNAYSIAYLKKYREESRKTIVFHKLKLKADAPHVVHVLETAGCVFK